MAKKPRSPKGNPAATDAFKIRSAHSKSNAFERLMSGKQGVNSLTESKRSKRRKKKVKSRAGRRTNRLEVSVRAIARRAATAEYYGKTPAQWRYTYFKSHTYSEYLLTPHWRKIRRSAIAMARHKCEECGSRKRLEVHHLTYKRVFEEMPDDLDVLCEECHKLRHPERAPLPDEV